MNASLKLLASCAALAAGTAAVFAADPIKIGFSQGTMESSWRVNMVERNKKWFDEQPQVNQGILIQAMKEAGQWQRKTMEQRDADATRRIGEAGVELIQLTPEAREQFRQLSQPVHDRFSAQVGQDYLQRLKAALEAAR